MTIKQRIAVLVVLGDVARGDGLGGGLSGLAVTLTLMPERL